MASHQIRSPKPNLFFFFFSWYWLCNYQEPSSSQAPYWETQWTFGNNTLEPWSNQSLRWSLQFCTKLYKHFCFVWILSSTSFVFQICVDCQPKRLGSVCGRGKLCDLDHEKDPGMNSQEAKQIYLAVQLPTEFVTGENYVFLVQQVKFSSILTNQHTLCF